MVDWVDFTLSLYTGSFQHVSKFVFQYAGERGGDGYQVSRTCCQVSFLQCLYYDWAPSSEFVSSNIPSWQISTAHAQPFRGARDLAFCLKVPLDSLLVSASSEGSGQTARMRRLAWTFAARIGDKNQIRLTRSWLIVIPSTFFLFCLTLISFVWFCSCLHHIITIRQCMFER